MRLRIEGRVSMSHAWLMAWRIAPITPLPATISSTTEIGPSRPVLSSASSTVRSSRARSSSWESGTFSNTASTTRRRISSSSKNSPKAPTSSIASGTKREHREERDLGRVAVPPVVDELQARAPERQQCPVE